MSAPEEDFDFVGEDEDFVGEDEEGDGSWARLLADHDIVVGCGSGGVGKTTISAAMALQGARMGRRSCVVTIDPARRLADSLGLESLGNVAHQVAGDWDGELWALQLDPKSTFDDLVRKHSDTDEQAEGILQNRLYRNLTEALSGTQEYMAMEKLYELSEEDRFDLIIVDTPPSRNALDFLEAPNRLSRFLGNRLFQFLMMPTRASLRAFSVASQALLKTISKVAGADIVNDAVAFFQAFAGMEEGFRLRASHMRGLLANQSTAFVLVSAPRIDTVAEAGWFADRLEDSGLEVDALVVNRVHPVFWSDESTVPEIDPEGDGIESSDLSVLADNLKKLILVNEREERTIEELVAQVAPAPVIRVPLLEEDVHDLAGLEKVADALFGDTALFGDSALTDEADGS
ncbi:MAG: ArsA-related P-loop ATPase [Acidimicrobiales bacterium]